MKFDPASKLVRNRRYVDYLDGKPISPQLVEVSLTGRCNADCPWCFYRKGGIEGHDGIDMNTGTIGANLLVMKRMGVEAINWTGGGEPTLHPYFGRLSAMANGIGLKQGLFTNALGKITYEPSMFEWIRVSKTNKSFDLENLRLLRQRGKSVGLTINYTGDVKEIEEALDTVARVGLDYVQVRPALDLQGKLNSLAVPYTPNFLKGNKAFSRLQVADYKFHEAEQERGYDLCEGFHFVPFIWHNGEVNVCAYQKGKEGYVLGNLHDKSFEEIMRDVPSAVPVSKDCQICCKNHEINQTIARARTLEDVTFL